ncbi:50S ribosomal protein L6 [Candidatus Microgenomates bacterium]|nr:50S ribosomal protein L6 [Candidatus Microgenomates bacterium]
MSRIGQKPIKIPDEVEVEITDNKVVVKGPKGSLDLNLRREIKLKKENNEIVVRRINETKLARSLHGLIRTLTANLIEGVTKGFSKTLELVGVGYRPSLEGEVLVLKVGFSHPVKITPPSGIKFEVVKNKIKISGINKQLVGDTAAKIRKVRPPDSYKGKGIRYEGEKVKTKPGKAAKTAGLGGG